MQAKCLLHGRASVGKPNEVIRDVHSKELACDNLLFRATAYKGRIVTVLLLKVHGSLLGFVYIKKQSFYGGFFS